MSAVQDAIDGAAAALDAIDWTTVLGENVIVDATPERWWTIENRRKQTILQVFGGGSEFTVMNRAGVLIEELTFYVATIRHVGFDQASLLRVEQLANAEAIQKKAIQTVRDWIVAHETLALSRIEKPDRYDVEQLAKGDFVSAVAFVVTDPHGML